MEKINEWINFYNCFIPKFELCWPTIDYFIQTHTYYEISMIFLMPPDVISKHVFSDIWMKINHWEIQNNSFIGKTDSPFIDKKCLIILWHKIILTVINVLGILLLIIVQHRENSQFKYFFVWITKQNINKQ